MIKPELMTGQDLSTEIRASFEANAANYLDDDIHWGNDVDFIFTEGKRLQRVLNRQLQVLYAGVGPGRILFDLLSQRHFFDYVRAIDFSPRMIELARERINLLEAIDPGSANACNLEVLNILDLKPRPLYDIALLLNNTLGNIVVNGSAQEGAATMLTAIRNVLRSNGILILTVYNINKFVKTNSLYTQRLKILKRENEQDFLLQLELNEERHLFFSHWFNLDEIRHLFQSAGYEVRAYEERQERIVICARKID